MCFSATASFTLSAILISTGIFSAITAYNANKNYLLLSLVPIIFGIQQCIEGLIWQQLHIDHFSIAQWYAYIYLFFAFYLWPVYVPICIYFIEKGALRKKILGTLVIAGLLLSIIMYAPILFGIIPSAPLIKGHSIHYQAYQSDLLIYTYSVCYIAILTLALLFSSEMRIKLFGIMILVASIAAYSLYIYAFTSMWCFFSAILSIYIAFIMCKLPDKTAESTALTQQMPHS